MLAGRLLRATAVVFVTGYVLYMVTLNVFLSTSLFDRVVNQDPVTLDVHYTRGWTLFPGTIHARNLSIRSSDSNVEWILRLDEVEFDVSFFGLAQKRFDVTRARGHGIRMRARRKLAVPPVNLEDVAHLPPIEGYPVYSMRPAGPPPLERWFDEHYALWTVRLANVIAEDVREVWVDQGRFEGRARVVGGFYLKPIRSVVVGPARVEAQPGSRVTLGRSTPIATDVDGSADLFIDRFDPRTLVNDDVLRYVSGKIALRARFADPATWPLALPIHLSSVVDARQVRLEIERGVLRPGTRVELAAPRITVAKDEVIGRGPFELVAEVVPRAGEDPELRANLVLPDVSVVTADATVIGRARRVVVRADARALDLARQPLADVHVGIDVIDGHAPDAPRLARFLPRDARVRVLRGAVHARAHVDVFRAEGRASGTLALVGEALDLESGRTRVRGSLDGRVEVGNYRFGEHAAESVSLVARSDDLELDLRGMRARATLDARARARDVHLDTKQLTLDRAVVELADVRVRRRVGAGVLARIDRASAAVRAPCMSLAEPFARAFVDAEIDGAHVADPSTLDAFLPAKATYGFTADHGSFDARAHFRVEDGVVRGHAAAKARSMGFRGEAISFRGDTDVDVAVTRWDVARKTLDLGPSRVVARNVRGRIGDRRDVGGALTAKRIEVQAAATGVALAAPTLRGVDAKLRFEDVVLPDARSLQFFVPARDGLRFVSGSARASGAVALSSSSRTAAGALGIDVDDGSFAINETELAGDFALRARFRGFDPDTSTIDLSGSTVTMRHVRVRGASAETAQWAGEITLDETALQFEGAASEAPRLDGVLHMDADDARPLLGVLLRRSVPKLLVGLVTMPRLRARARMHVSPNLVLLSDVSASGGDVAVRGTYGLYGNERRGAFIVEKGPLSVGIALEKKRVSAHFFNLGAWLGAHERTSRAKAAAVLDGDVGSRRRKCEGPASGREAR